MSALVAMSMKLVPRTLLTKGKERDARKLHSMTFNADGAVPVGSSALIICMLNGPVIVHAFATFSAISFTRAMISGSRFAGGSTSVASPEWTPAASTCSLTA